MTNDTAILSGMPGQALLGFDALSFTARKFQGFRNIPSGTHLLWTSETDKAMRSAVWIISIGAGQTHVVQWDGYNEVLTQPLAAEILAQKQALATSETKNTDLFDCENPPNQAGSNSTTNADASGLWSRLTACVSPAVLNRILICSSDLWFCHTTDCVRGSLILPSEVALNSTLSSATNATTTEQELVFTFGPGERTFGVGLVGAARTEAAVDSTAHILDKISQLSNEADLVGEMQFAFLVGMHLGNESCLQEWWHMVLRLFFRAYMLAEARPWLTVLFLDTFAAQIKYDSAFLEESIFDHASSNTKDLRLCITVYGRRIRESLEPLASSSSDAAAVLAAFQKLEDELREIGWDVSGDYLRSGQAMLEDGEMVDLDVDDFEDEDERGEFAAVVVDLDEEGRQRDLVSWG
ncbi:hypothetical protein Cpir12675_005278 [Ceratocystis pirilliformis]|uniref:Uncharacterized protein n=1 Tax=Ceratocystis pirilliformis TaxID=259994 RepID=A0ABR3YS59_9PEZI